jgi:uncharacterized membrane protein HdeD (DUF308 family)
VAKNKESEGSAGFSLAFVLLYLLSSFFASLLFSCLMFRSRSNGNGGWGWMILSLICAFVFGYISLAFVETCSPTQDAGWYYLGYSTLIANGFSMLILLLAIFKRS